MAIVRKQTGECLIRTGDNIYQDQWGTLSQAKSFCRVSAETAARLTTERRAAGIECYVANDAGEIIENVRKDTPAVNEDVVWPSTWRIEIARVGERYVHKYLDSFGEQHSVIGSSPQDVVDKISTPIPSYVEYLQSITPPDVAPSAPVETLQQVPGRVLRPGSRQITEDEMRMLEATRAQRKAVVVNPHANFEAWVDSPTTSTAMIKEQVKINPEFKAWWQEASKFELQEKP